MIIPRIDEFRIYYNLSIRPELVRMETERKRMLFAMVASVSGLVALVILFILIDAGFVLLVFALPILFYLSTLYFRIEKFRQRFKPNVMQLILEFLNSSTNLEGLSYDAKGMVAQDRFQLSELFAGRKVSYAGEDYIKGIVGEMPFELSELYVQEVSNASNRLNLVFGGIFIHAIFNEDVSGHLACWPRSLHRYHRRTIKEFIFNGGLPAEVEIHNDEFNELFVVYAKQGTTVHHVLTRPMQDAFVEFIDRTGHEIYFSIHNKNIFVGISHDRDLLEPNIVRSNLSYDLIRTFYVDIVLMLDVIKTFDQNR